MPDAAHRRASDDQAAQGRPSKPPGHQARSGAQADPVDVGDSAVPASGSRGAADGRRARYIRHVALGYALLALAWILLSDQLLTAMVGVEAMVRVSSAKGVFFVLVSALAFYVALAAVPERDSSLSAATAAEDAITRGLPERWPAWAPYTLAVALVGTMLLIRQLIAGSQGDRAMLVLFTLPISLAALLGGLGPGLLATALASVVTAVWVLQPIGQITIHDPRDLFQWVLLAGSGVLVSVISESLHRSREHSQHRLKLLKASHSALVTSEARVQRLYDDAPVAMSLVGWDGGVLSLNRHFQRLFGYSLDDLRHLDDWWRRAFPDQTDREQLQQVWNAQLLHGADYGDNVAPSEHRIRTADGRDRAVQISQRRMDQGVLATFVDVTERREAEAHLQLWAEAFSQAQVGLAMADAQTNRFIAVNPAFARERGYEADELVGRPIGTVFPPERLDTLRSIVTTADLQGHGVVESEHQSRDGRIFPVLLDITSLRDAKGQPLRRIVFALDLTERQRAEQALAEAQAQALAQQNLARIAALNQMQDANVARRRAEAALRALRESENRLALFIAHAPAALAMFDRDMCYVAASRRWRVDYGLGDRDLRGLNHYEVFPEIDDDLRAVHRRGLAGEVMGSEEARFERSDGSVRWVRWEMHPWLDGDARVGGIVIFTEDITARKLAEDELHALNLTLESRVAERTAELAKLNQSLESFVYSVSHDLKAPLRGVEGYSRFLQDDYANQLGDEGRLFIRNIRDGVARMGELIDDLLAYSRMERRPLAPESLNLAALVTRVVEERRSEITQRGVRVNVELPALTVRADSDGLQIVVRNLLENALKFTVHSTDPCIDIRGHEADGHVALSVQDNGVGFDMKYCDRIFEVFQRLHRVEDYPGTGVGLALVRKAMDRMGGRVWAQSSPGQGATFFLDLPAASIS